jgi:hypothetical protein
VYAKRRNPRIAWTSSRLRRDRLRDGSRDAPAHPGERRIADSQGSVVNIHTGRVPRRSSRRNVLQPVTSLSWDADRQLVLNARPDSSKAIGITKRIATNPASRTFFATSQSSQPITVRFTGP